MFKVGDKVIAIKDRPALYDVTTDKVVCKVISLHGSGMMTVVLLDDEYDCDYTVDPKFFRYVNQFKGNKHATVG